MDRVKKLMDDDEGTSGNERGITLIPCQNLRGKDLRGMMSPFLYSYLYVNTIITHNTSMTPSDVYNMTSN